MILYGPDNKPLVGSEHDPMVEVTRSFSYKLNAALHGGGNYESRDFFCSQKSQCRASEAVDAGHALYAYCRAQVMESVADYIVQMKEQQTRKGERKAMNIAS